MRTYSAYQNDIPRILNNSLTDNLTWGTELVNDSIRYLVRKYYFDERSYTTTTLSQQQFYNLPPQCKELINVTVTIGGVVWQLKPCPSRQYWDSLNTITFYQDFPSFFFVYNGQVGIFPTPSSAGNTITMNYKIRTIDLSMADVTEATVPSTVAIVSSATTVTASAGGTFKNWMDNAWIRVPFSNTDSLSGDNQWYQIDSVTSSTVLVLRNPYTGASVTGASFTVGEAPILPEQYQDLPLYQMGMIYYTTRFPDPVRADQYTKLYEKGIAQLDEEYGAKTTQVTLVDTDDQVYNPNLFTQSVSQN
jgi:hypothetical protein